jgi:PPOX class probable F420-dependent enzyme
VDDVTGRDPDPPARRPYMPGYGILDATSGTGLLPWAWATGRLAASHDYFVATVTPDGRPHLMPVWGVWADDSLWFSVAPGSRKSRNLAASARIAVATDDALAPVVVEGTARRVSDPGAVERFAAAVNAKYDSDYPVQFFADNACFAVVPEAVFGIDTEDFAGSPTRWDLRPGY